MLTLVSIQGSIYSKEGVAEGRVMGVNLTEVVNYMPVGFAIAKRAPCGLEENYDSWLVYHTQQFNDVVKRKFKG